MAENKNVITRVIRAVFDQDAAKMTQAELVTLLDTAGRKGGEVFVKKLRESLDKRMKELNDQLAKGLISEDDFRKQGDAAAREFNGAMLKALETGGQRGGQVFLRGLRDAFDARMADLKLQLASGVIDYDEFRKQGDVAAREFNAGMVKGIEAARKEGTLTEREYVRLARQLKRTGDEGESAWTRIRGSIIRAAASVAAFFALDRITSFGHNIIQEALEAEKSATRLRAVWEANAGAVGRTFTQMQQFTKSVRDTTLFSTNDIELATSQLLTYKSISGDTFERTIKLATDLSSVFGGLSQSTSALAKALDDPIRGLGELRKSGFTFTESATQQIKKLVEQNQLYAAQRVILAALEDEVSGVAQKMQSGWVGAVDRYSKAWGDLREELGKALLDASGGPSVLDRLTGAMRRAATKAQEILGLIVDLTKAIMISGLLTGFGLLIKAIRAATIATTGFATAMRASLALIGPKGWFVLGVAALTTLFQGMSAKARQAAADAREAMEDFKGALEAASDAELGAKAAQVAARKAALEREIAGLQPPTGGNGRPTSRGQFGSVATQISPEDAKRAEALKNAQQELNTITAQGAAIEEERANRKTAAYNADQAAQEAAAAALADENEKAANAAKAQRERFQERQAELAQEIADLKVLQQVQGAGDAAIAATTKKLGEERELRELLKGLSAKQAIDITKQVVARNRERDAVAELARVEQERRAAEASDASLAWQDRQEEIRQKYEVLPALHAELEAILRRKQAERDGSAAVAALNRELFIQDALFRSGATAGSAFAQQVADLAGKQWDAAQEFVRPWTDVLGLLEDEVNSKGTLFRDLAQAWANGGLAGLAQLAKAKVKENIARAIEEAAKALGSLGLGNPSAAKKHAASAAKHTAAAAAWGSLSAAVGSGGSSGNAAGGGGTAGGFDAGAAPEKPKQEVVIVFDGPGFDALNPRVQQVIFNGMEQARERYGENAIVRVERRR